MGCCYLIRNPEIHELGETGLAGFDSTIVFENLRCGLSQEKRDAKRTDFVFENMNIINNDQEDEDDLLTLELPNPTSEVSLSSWRYPSSPQSFK